MTKAEALERARTFLSMCDESRDGFVIDEHILANALRLVAVERWLKYRRLRAKSRAALMARIGCKFCGERVREVYMLADGMWARLGMAPNDNAHLKCIDLHAAKKGIDLAEWEHRKGAPIELVHFTEAKCNDNIRWAFIEGRASE